MSPSPTSEERNPYTPSPDWKPGQDTFTAQAAGIWDEGFTAGRAAFDAVVAERDEARAKLNEATRLNMAPTRDDEVDALHGLIEQRDRLQSERLAEARAERDAAISAGQDALHEMASVAGLLRMLGDEKAIRYGDRLSKACHAFREVLAPGMNEAIAAQFPVSGSGERPEGAGDD